MNDLRELGVILALCAAGDVLSTLIGGALPGNVLGMMLLLVLLVTRVLKSRHIEHAADFFLKNMAIFFLPVSLGVLELYADLHSQLAAILAVCVLTTFITAFVTAGTVHLVLRLQKRSAKARERGCHTAASTDLPRPAFLSRGQEGGEE